MKEEKEKLIIGYDYEHDSITQFSTKTQTHTLITKISLVVMHDTLQPYQISEMEDFVVPTPKVNTYNGKTFVYLNVLLFPKTDNEQHGFLMIDGSVKDGVFIPEFPSSENLFKKMAYTNVSHLYNRTKLIPTINLN